MSGRQKRGHNAVVEIQECKCLLRRKRNFQMTVGYNIYIMQQTTTKLSILVSSSPFQNTQLLDLIPRTRTRSIRFPRTAQCFLYLIYVENKVVLWQCLKAASLKILVAWDFVPCTDVSEVFILPPSSRWWRWRLQANLKYQSISIRLHGTTSKKTIISTCFSSPWISLDVYKKIENLF